MGGNRHWRYVIGAPVCVHVPPLSKASDSALTLPISPTHDQNNDCRGTPLVLQKMAWTIWHPSTPSL